MPLSILLTVRNSAQSIDNALWSLWYELRQTLWSNLETINIIYDLHSIKNKLTDGDKTYPLQSKLNSRALSQGTKVEFRSVLTSSKAEMRLLTLLEGTSRSGILDPQRMLYQIFLSQLNLDHLSSL